MANYSNEHPTYQGLIKRYKMAYDFFRGGVCVLSPDHDVSKYHFAVKTTEPSSDPGAWDNGLDPVDREYVSVYEWRSVPSRSYLWKHPAEQKWDYEERTARAVHLPLFQPLVNVYVSAVLRIGAMLKGVDTDPDWMMFTDNIDLRGTDLDAFRREALSMALTFGRIHAIVDMVKSDQMPKSQQHQRELGVRPYVNLVSPLDLIDWEVDSKNRFKWVVIRELSEDMRLPGQEKTEPKHNYRLWTRDGWELYSMNSEADAWVQLDGGTHSHGEVPLATLWTVRDRTMGCESPMASALDMDRHLLNKFSDMDVLERTQCFSLLGVPTKAGQALGSIEVGPNRAFGFDSDAGAPVYLNPGDHSSTLWSHMMEKYMSARLAEGVSKTMGEAPSADRTAAAISAQGEEKRNRCGMYAASTQEFENKIFSLASRWWGKSNVPHTAFQRNYDLGGVGDQINNILQLGSRDEMTPQAVAALINPVLERILRDHGISQKDIDIVTESVNTKAGKILSEADGS